MSSRSSSTKPTSIPAATTGRPSTSRGSIWPTSPARVKFRVRDLKSASDKGELRGFEVELPQLSSPDERGTGDLWVTVYRGDSVEQGAEVGMKCDDRELEELYAVGPLDTTNGSDIVLWVAIRHHHEARHLAEEAEYLPYHYEGFSIMPRGFEVFRVDKRDPEPG
jgi:hypothetical protein